jgi:molybdate transport system permease protein
MQWTALILTFKLAALTSLILFVVALPLAYFLAYSSFRGKILLDVFIGLPLVLPPTVLGFYLLLAFSPTSQMGSFLQSKLGLSLAFSFEGILLGSLIYSLPFMVYPIRTALKNIPKIYHEVAQTLGKSKWTTFWKVLLPNIQAALISGIILTFAHTVGEFGVVLMIGGNIPGETKVASIAIFEEVEAFNFELANQYAWILLAFSAAILLLFFFLNSYSQKKRSDD